jgi:hypothetical protein
MCSNGPMQTNFEPLASVNNKLNLGP